MIILLVTLAQSIPQAPTLITGNQLYEFCTTDTPRATELCRVYIAGAADMLMATQAVQGVRSVCQPSSVSARQIADIVTADMRDHPRDRSASAAAIIKVALTNAFPCSP